MRIKTYIQFINESIKTSSSKLHDLIKYFEVDIDSHIEDLPEFFHYYTIFNDWINDNINPNEESEDIEIPDSWQWLYHNDHDKYLKYCNYLYDLCSDKSLINQYEIEYLPLFATYTYESDINSWLVHFTETRENVNGILQHGFKGVGDFVSLANTGGSQETGISNGYCFSFELKDSYYNFRNSYGHYGKNGVIFKAPGIKLYHNGDDELQTIFVANEATNLIGFIYNDNKDEYQSLDGKISNSDFDEFAELIINK